MSDYKEQYDRDMKAAQRLLKEADTLLNLAHENLAEHNLHTTNCSIEAARKNLEGAWRQINLDTIGCAVAKESWGDRHHA